MKTLLSSQSLKLNKFTIFVNLYKYDTNREYYDISYVKNDENDENDKFDIILDGVIIPKSHITIQLVKILLQESITDEDIAKIEKLSKYISNLSNERIYKIQNYTHDCCSKQQFKNSFEFIQSSKLKNIIR